MALKQRCTRQIAWTENCGESRLAAAIRAAGRGVEHGVRETLMTMRSGFKNSGGIIVGAIGLLAALLVVLHDYKEADPVAQLAAKHQRIALVDGMRLALSTASETANSAVMAITDSESQAFADQARTAANTVDHGREELARLLEAGGSRTEIDLLASFSRAFADYLRIDNSLLELAVKNTNLKAYSLAFGPAAESIHDMDQALSSIVTENAESNAPHARQVMLLAARATSGALRMQAQLAPHISEASDQKMDALDASIAAEEREVRSCLDRLAPIIPPAARPRFEKAAASYARFTELKAQILDLSRQNTNVRSLTMSLNEKRLATEKCQDILTALQQAIQAEPVSDQTPANPRKL